MLDLSMRISDTPDATIEEMIGEGLARFNEEQAGYSDGRPLAVLVSQADDEVVVGGLLGRTYMGLFFIDLVYLPAALRGGGAGSKMLAMAESEARARKCSSVVLFTITFQAPGFYQRCGYRELGRIECAPPGATRICMTKAL
jgi:GNAT superfamily N-acetyltransferase